MTKKNFNDLEDDEKMAVACSGVGGSALILVALFYFIFQAFGISGIMILSLGLGVAMYLYASFKYKYK